MRLERRLGYETEGRADSALSELLWSGLVCPHTSGHKTCSRFAGPGLEWAADPETNK